MKQILIAMKEMDKSTFICGYFKIPFSVIGRTTRQKNNNVKNKQTLASHHQT